jgi:dCMP deaminase
MWVALLSAQRSKDPLTQVGACIINDDKVIVGTGYNGFPKWCSDDKFPWDKNPDNAIENKHSYVVHAEVNAILNANASTKWSTMYVWLFPCNECAKIIIQSGIKKIIYGSDSKIWREDNIASKRMLDAAGIEYSLFQSSWENLEIYL